MLNNHVDILVHLSLNCFEIYLIVQFEFKERGEMENELRQEIDEL
jgi:hypothetical protein